MNNNGGLRIVFLQNPKNAPHEWISAFNTYPVANSAKYLNVCFYVTSLSLITCKFLQLVNREMFWVVTEVCSEHNLVRRSKIIKQFIKVASK
jgi:Rap guanine nucleotide exchange factor 2